MESFANLGLYLEFTTQQVDAFADADQAKASARVGRARSIVEDGEADGVRLGEIEGHVGAGGAGVLADVGQSLLRRAVEGERGFGFDGTRLAEEMEFGEDACRL